MLTTNGSKALILLAKFGLVAAYLTGNAAFAIAANPAPSANTRAQAAATQEQAAPATSKQTVNQTIVTPPKPKPRPKASAYMGLGATIVNVHGFTGLMPKLSLGYGSFFGSTRSAYLGGEVFTGIWTIPLTNNQYYRTTNVYGVSVQPGYQTANQVLYFLRLGAENANFRTQGSNNIGALVGLGFQAMATEHWDLRGEYNYGTNKNLNLYSLDAVYHFFR